AGCVCTVRSPDSVTATWKKSTSFDVVICSARVLLSPTGTAVASVLPASTVRSSSGSTSKRAAVGRGRRRGPRRGGADIPVCPRRRADRNVCATLACQSFDHHDRMIDVPSASSGPTDGALPRWEKSSLTRLGHGLLTVPLIATEGLLLQQRGDLRSSRGHGQETVPQPAPTRLEQAAQEHGSSSLPSPSNRSSTQFFGPYSAARRAKPGLCRIGDRAALSWM